MAISQLSTGLFFVTLYQPPSDGNPLCEHWKPLIASALTVAATLPALYLVDRVGRRRCS